MLALMNPLLKLALETGPLALFFVANARYDLMVGTAIFMVATVVALIVNWSLERRLPVMPLVGCFFVLVFGGLTLWLKDETFIKFKPTAFNLMIAAGLFIGVRMRRNLLKVVLGAAINMTEEGWRILNVRWAWFFLVLAAENEIVWRFFSTDIWVDFKVFGVMPLTVVFSLIQVPLILKYQPPTPESEPPQSRDEQPETPAA